MYNTSIFIDIMILLFGLPEDSKEELQLVESIFHAASGAEGRIIFTDSKLNKNIKKENYVSEFT
jgi:hypothetical protein